MKYSVAAVLAAAVAGASAHYGLNVTVTTEVVESYVTYCPYATEITHGTKTYTVTKPTTLTITDCPCTITKPIITTSEVICHDCGYTNSTGIVTLPSTTAVGTGVVTVPAPIPTGDVPGDVPAGAGKAAALSGAGLAGLVGLAAFVL